MIESEVRTSSLPVTEPTSDRLDSAKVNPAGRAEWVRGHCSWLAGSCKPGQGLSFPEPRVGEATQGRGRTRRHCTWELAQAIPTRAFHGCKSRIVPSRGPSIDAWHIRSDKGAMNSVVHLPASGTEAQASQAARFEGVQQLNLHKELATAGAELGLSSMSRKQAQRPADQGLASRHSFAGEP